LPPQLATENLALFIWLIIRLIQLVFSARTVFFSHEKSVNSVFQPAYNSSRTAPLSQFGHCLVAAQLVAATSVVFPLFLVVLRCGELWSVAATSSTTQLWH
jgi:hypothetical protein